MGRIIGKIVNAIFYIFVLPSSLISRLEYKIFHFQFFFTFFASWYCFFPGIFGNIIRRMYYNQVMESCDLSTIFLGSLITKINSKIGRRVHIGAYTTIGLANIGENTVIANYVSLLSGRRQHNFQEAGKDVLAGEDTFAELKIGKDCFIGEKCIIMADIGDNCIIGAGAVVVKDVPSYSVAVGNPAKVIKTRNS